MPSAPGGTRKHEFMAMRESTIRRTTTVVNPEGIHARAATLIAQTARGFGAAVAIRKDVERVDATDVLQILSLGAGPGETLTLEATGSDAAEAIEALAGLIESGFRDKDCEGSRSAPA